MKTSAAGVPRTVWQRRRREAGQALPLIAFAMVALSFFVALAADATRIYVYRRDLIRIGDGAIIAGASGLGASADVTDTIRQQRATARAREYALLNGLDPDLPGNALSVSFPSTNPPRQLINVTVTRTVSTIFGQLLGINQVAITSGSHQGERSSIDLVLILDRSGSMCSNNYSQLDCTTLHGPSTPYDNTNYCPFGSPPFWFGCTLSDVYDATRPTDYNSSSPNLNVPWQPWGDVQSAAQFFMDQMDPRYDQVAVVSFAAQANLDARLSTSYNGARNAIGLSPPTTGTRGVAGLRPGGFTATASALSTAINELLSFPPAGSARSGAVGAIVLLSDGAPTRTLDGTSAWPCSPGFGPTSPWCTQARQDVMTLAQTAASAGIVIYTIFFEDVETEAANGGLMQYVADVTDDGVANLSLYSLPSAGTLVTPSPTQNYFVASDATSLQAAFQTIANRVYTRITE